MLIVHYERCMLGDGLCNEQVVEWVSVMHGQIDQRQPMFGRDIKAGKSGPSG